MVREGKQSDGKSMLARKVTLLEGRETQSPCAAAHSYSKAKMWFIFWIYQDESILKMKNTSSSKWRVLIKLFDKDQKMFISIRQIHCILLSIQLHRFWLPWKYLGFFQKCPEENHSKQHKPIPISGATLSSRSYWSLHISISNTGSVDSEDNIGFFYDTLHMTNELTGISVPLLILLFLGS